MGIEPAASFDGTRPHQIGGSWRRGGVLRDGGGAERKGERGEGGREVAHRGMMPRRAERSQCVVAREDDSALATRLSQNVNQSDGFTVS
jgi:hypothetical protein